MLTTGYLNESNLPTDPVCKNLGVEVGGERLFEGGVLAGDYGDGSNLRKLPG